MTNLSKHWQAITQYLSAGFAIDPVGVVTLIAFLTTSAVITSLVPKSAQIDAGEAAAKRGLPGRSAAIESHRQLRLEGFNRRKLLAGGNLTNLPIQAANETGCGTYSATGFVRTMPTF